MVDLAVEGLGTGELIGGGASSSVFAATRLAFGDRVAVKVLKQTLTDAQSRTHFEREARALTELADIPGIVAVLDSGINTRGEPYLVFPLFEDSAQGDVNTNGPMDPARAARIVAGAARAVHGGHLRGVIHRDIKPANLLLTNSDDIFVSDFGIAKLTDSSVSASGWLGLTPAYAPPEALEGIAAGVSGDVYSLGATLAALVIGAPPFSSTGSESPIALLNRVVNQPAPDLTAFGAPAAMAAVVARAMAKDPEQRYDTALDLAVVLEGSVTSDATQVVAAPPAAAPPPDVAPPPASAPPSIPEPPAPAPPAPVQAVAPPASFPAPTAAPPVPPPVAPAAPPVTPLVTPPPSQGGSKNVKAIGAAVAVALAAIIGAFVAFGMSGDESAQDGESVAPTAVVESTPQVEPTTVRRQPATAVAEPTVAPAPTEPAAAPAPTPQGPILFEAVPGGPVDVYPDGSGEAPNLTTAIARARDGDVIRLSPGTFEIADVIRIRSDITIIGAGIDETVLVATNSASLLAFQDTPGRLRNLTIRSTFTEPDSFGLLEVSNSPSMVLDSVKIADSPGFGVAVISSTLSATNSDFSASRLSGIGIGDASVAEITTSTATGNGQSGYVVFDDSPVTFLSSDAIDNDLAGFSVEASGSPQFVANTARGNGVSGFQFLGSSTPVLRGNRSTSNGDSGFAWFDSTAGTAIGNHASDNTRAGFSMNEESAPTLTANTGIANTESGFLWSGSATGLAVGNRSEGNELNGYAVIDTGAPELRGNRADNNEQGNIFESDGSLATIDDTGIVQVEVDGTGDVTDIATAVARASNGDVILLGAGRHVLASSITVNKDLTLVGLGPAQTTVEVTGQNTTFLIENTPIRVLDMTLTTTFETDDDADRFSVIEIDGSPEFTVDRVEVLQSVGIGIGIFGSTGTISNSQVRDSHWSGIGLSSGTQVVISRVESNRNGQSGVVFFEDAEGKVAGSVANENTFFGFSVQGTGSPEFIANFSSGNEGSGYGASETASPRLVGNTALANNLAGFSWFDTASGSAVANTSSENETSGFNMTGSSTPALVVNSADANEVDGFTWFETSSGTATGNLAEGNTFDGFAAEGESSPTLERNVAVFNERRSFNQSGEASPTLTDNEFP